MLHTKAFDPLELGMDTTLDSKGAHKMRSGQEEHLYNPRPFICCSCPPGPEITTPSRNTAR